MDFLIERKVDILFTVGGDGTQRGGNDLYQEAARRGHPLAVVGIPKTIDNDVRFVSRTFGFGTAVDEAVRVIDSAHTEARSVDNGVSLVKLMGRHAGFIAAAATVASQDVNFCLVPEQPLRPRRSAWSVSRAGGPPGQQGPRRHRRGRGRRPGAAWKTAAEKDASGNRASCATSASSCATPSTRTSKPAGSR